MISAGDDLLDPAPHPQQIQTDPTGRYALVTDLGLDKIFVYQINTASGTLRLHSQLDTEPGSGPKRQPA